MNRHPARRASAPSKAEHAAGCRLHCCAPCCSTHRILWRILEGGLASASEEDLWPGGRGRPTLGGGSCFRTGRHKAVCTCMPCWRAVPGSPSVTQTVITRQGQLAAGQQASQPPHICPAQVAAAVVPLCPAPRTCCSVWWGCAPRAVRPGCWRTPRGAGPRGWPVRASSGREVHLVPCCSALCAGGRLLEPMIKGGQ